MRRTRVVALTRLRCTECGAVFILWRLQSRRRAEGHVKHLWCFCCQEVTAHRELATWASDNAASLH